MALIFVFFTERHVYSIVCFTVDRAHIDHSRPFVCTVVYANVYESVYGVPIK